MTTTMILSSAMFVSRRGPFFAAFSSSASASSLFSISSRASSLLGSNHRLGGGGGDIHKNDTAAIGRCRYKHSERQINRLFRKHPARARVDARLGIERQKENVEEISSKKPTYEAVFHEAKILPNGWSKPPPDDFQRPQYPFSLSRTKNKPNNAVGYLPVYAKFRKDGTKAVTRIKKVTGDRDDFLRELRVVLQLPNPKNPKEDPVRIRTGGTIEVSGNHVRTVRQWLAGLGF